MSRELTPDRILQLGLGFWGSKALLSAVELGVFTELAKGPRRWEELSKALGLNGRGARDFFDALVSLGMLNRDGERYSNTPESDFFLDRAKPTYAGGILEMANGRLYGFWGHLTEGLKTGEPQNEVRAGKNLFDELYSDPSRLRLFLEGMTGISLGVGRAIAAKFPWGQYKTFFDVGCAQGGVTAQIALAHKHLSGGGFDLPPVKPIFEEYMRRQGVADRMRFVAGNMFKEEWPRADVLVMGHILHDWNLEEKKDLLRRAHEALPKGGSLIVHEAIIDDERKSNAFGLLMSVNMLIETRGGFDFTGADCQQWMRKAGFSRTRVEPLVGPDSMVVGVK